MFYCDTLSSFNYVGVSTQNLGLLFQGDIIFMNNQASGGDYQKINSIYSYNWWKGHLMNIKNVLAGEVEPYIIGVGVNFSSILFENNTVDDGFSKSQDKW